MKTEEVLHQLGDLKAEAEGYYTDDGDDEVFRRDAEALTFAIDAIKSNGKIADAIRLEIDACNREIRKASDSIINYGDQKLVLKSLLKTVKKE